MLGWLQEFCVLPGTAMPEERAYMKSKLPILLEPDKFLQVLPLWIIHSSADAVQKEWSEQ
jgi:hypothetical protein